MPRGGKREGAGRKPGSKHRTILRREHGIASTIELCAQYDYNPIEALIQLAQDENNDVEVRIQCHRIIAPFVYAKLKTIELKAADDELEALVNLFHALTPHQMRAAFQGAVGALNPGQTNGQAAPETVEE